MRIFTLSLVPRLMLASCCLVAACASKEPAPTGVPPMPASLQAMATAAGPGAVFTGTAGPNAAYGATYVSTMRASGLVSDLALPDGHGGVVVLPGQAYARSEPPGYVDARELKLKIRELADQLIAGMDNSGLRGSVALPVSFVTMDNYEQSSSFGRLIAEQLFYEFNQRGFAIREYHAPRNISIREDGDFYLSREMGELCAARPGTVVVAGTYHADRDAVFVNARLLRPTDGRVLRSANLVLRSNSLTRRLVNRNTGATVETCTTGFRNFKDATAPPLYNPIDMGADIH